MGPSNAQKSGGKMNIPIDDWILRLNACLVSHDTSDIARGADLQRLLDDMKAYRDDLEEEIPQSGTSGSRDILPKTYMFRGEHLIPGETKLLMAAGDPTKDPYKVVTFLRVLGSKDTFDFIGQDQDKIGKPDFYFWGNVDEVCNP